MTTPDPARRQFLRRGSGALCAFLLGGLAGAPGLARAQGSVLIERLAELGPLEPPDSNGIRLPRGFRSRIVARSGERVLPDGKFRWHRAPDGGACYAAPGGGWIYVSNSEVSRGRGGAGALRFDAAGEIVAAYPILERTDYNCAGGTTPWNTWLSCEEVDRGLVWECDPFGEQPARALPALGRFEHEAVAVDPLRQVLYLTEDVEDGGFYRFRPARGLPDLADGMLEIAEVLDRGPGLFIVWHPVPDPAGRALRTRHQVPARTAFNGGEGIAWSDDIVHFTTKGDDRVWRYDCRTSALQILYDAAAAQDPLLRGVDNLTITPAGDVLVAEDGGDMQIVGLTADGSPVPVLQIVGQDESEICGPAFTPAFDRLYFSSQTGPKNRDRDGITYEVSRI